MNKQNLVVKRSRERLGGREGNDENLWVRSESKFSVLRGRNDAECMASWIKFMGVAGSLHYDHNPPLCDARAPTKLKHYLPTKPTLSLSHSHTQAKGANPQYITILHVQSLPCTYPRFQFTIPTSVLETIKTLIL